MRSAFCCILCLGILYAAILRHDGYLVDPASLAAAARTVPQQAGKSLAAAAVPQVLAFCQRDAAACLAGAAALARPSSAAEVLPRGRTRGVLAAGTP